MAACKRFAEAVVHGDGPRDNSNDVYGVDLIPPGFLEILCFISPRTGHISPQVLKKLPHFFLDIVCVRLSCRGGAPMVHP